MNSFRIAFHTPGQTTVAFDATGEESLLDALEQAGLSLPHDCRLGGCGTCRIKVSAGDFQYEDPPFGLTPEDEQAGYALACQAHPRSDMVIEPAGDALLADPVTTQARIVAHRCVSPSVTWLRLALPDGLGQDFRPGQYLNVVLGDGSRRSFSMATVPGTGIVELHIKQVEGGRFTQALLPTLTVGDTLEVELPLGRFRLHAEDYRPLVMVATGTGLAPIKAMLESLMDDSDCPPVSLYWGVRSQADLYWHEEILRWGARLYEFNYVPVLSQPDATWAGARGYVQDAVCRDFADLSEHALYLCGAPAMVGDALARFAALGADPACTYVDSFTFQHEAGVPPSDRVAAT